jgi:glycerol-3-phosphate dehydrogenase
LEDLAESSPERVKILKKAKVTKVLKEGETVIGVDYEKDGKQVRAVLRLHYIQKADRLQYTEHGAVILATGGYAADFTSDSLLKKHRPEYYDLVSSTVTIRPTKAQCE